MKGNIHSFETFGAVDGPGIRFVLFMQGCPMRCKYCHNPDTWCSGRNRLYAPEEILEHSLKYRRYYENGGVTVSGGEPLLQAEFVCEFFRLCKENGLHTALDTSGIVFDPQRKEIVDAVDRLMRYCDLVLLDIKHIDPLQHEALTGWSNRNVLAFAKYLDGCRKPMWIRHVLVPGITTDRASLIALRDFIKTLHTVEKVEVLPYHTMGKEKYMELGIPYPLEGVGVPTKEQIAMAQQILKSD